ncbi:MAG TPA: hypothetical protein VK709_02915 [Candidatus Saccharimonadales bacterium]|jgi:hypothetical protein|nr:hypothetical protein [Candidatus Saccharimonadales bacterium]
MITITMWDSGLGEHSASAHPLEERGRDGRLSAGAPWKRFKAGQIRGAKKGNMRRLFRTDNSVVGIVLKCHSTHLQTTVSVTGSTTRIDFQEPSARVKRNALTKVLRGP